MLEKSFIKYLIGSIWLSLGLFGSKSIIAVNYLGKRRNYHDTNWWFDKYQVNYIDIIIPFLADFGIKYFQIHIIVAFALS